MLMPVTKNRLPNEAVDEASVARGFAPISQRGRRVLGDVKPNNGARSAVNKSGALGYFDRTVEATRRMAFCNAGEPPAS